MAGVFTGTKPKDTYDSLLHIESNDAVNAGYQYVTDGLGNYSTIEVSTMGTRITNTTLNGTLTLGSPLALTYGGLGVSLADPNADRLFFWDDSAGSTAFLSLGPNLSITGTTIDAIGGGVTDHGALTGLADDDHSQYHTDGRADTWLGTKTTTNLTEGVNLYYTSARFNTAFGTKTTSDLTEGANLYYTNARADARIAAAAGVTIQNYDTTLSTLAALATAADKLPYFTGVDTSALTDFTAYARTLLDDANAAAMRTTLGLGTLATQDGTFSGTSSGTNTGDQDLFKTIAVSGQDNIVADSATDTLTIVAGTNIGITTDAATDTITITNTATGLTDADYGDITVSGGGTVFTIDNDAVTYSKIQNVSATDKLLGRVSGGAGDVEEITCTDFAQSLLDDADATAGRSTLGVVIGTNVQAYDATLTAFAAYNTNGLLTQTAADTFTGRTLTGTANEITVADGDGVAANPTVSLPAALTFTGKTVTNGTFTTPTINVNDDVLSIRDNGDTTKIMQFQCSGISAGTTRTLTSPDASGTIALTADLADYQPVDSTLTALAAHNTNGIITQTGADTFTGRTITGTANQITVSNGDGVAGNPTLSIPYNVNLGSSASGSSSIAFFEDTDNGSNKITVTVPSAIGSDYTLTLPSSAGTNNYVATTDGAGTLEFTDVDSIINLGLVYLTSSAQISG